MAGRIDYDVGFNVDKSGLQQAKTSLQQLKQLTAEDLLKINPKINTDQAKKDLIEIKAQVENVKQALGSAFNTKLNTVNIEQFKQSLASSKTSLEQIYQTFSKAGAVGQSAFRTLSAQVLSTNIQLRQSHSLLDKMAVTLTNTIKWNAASSAINGITRSVQQAWGYVKNLDTSLNNIRIVTGKSAEQMDRFAEKANTAAQNLGRTTTDYTNAALIYAQQGLSDQEIEARTDITLKTANVTQQSTADVSEQLTAVWNGYKVNADQAELYVDRLAAVAATTASNLQELSTAMSKVASAANAMGVGEDQLAAQLSTIIAATRQAPESVGTALRTIYARISDIKAGIDEDGVTLGRYSGKMAELGFNVLDAQGHLRDMGQVMEQIGMHWENLTREQQVNLAQTMAGQRQYNNLLALFDNFDKYTSSLNTAQNAAGTLQEQQNIRMDSTVAHLNTLKASVENVYDSLVDPKALNPLIDGLSKVANLFANFVDSIGGGGAMLQSLGAIGVSVFSSKIANSLTTTITNMQIAKDNAAQFKAALDATREWQGIPGLDKLSQDLLKDREQLLEFSRLLNPQQFKQMQDALNLRVEKTNQFENAKAQLQIFEKSISTMEQYQRVANKGAEATQKDWVQAQQSIANKLEQTSNAFKKAKNDIVDYRNSLKSSKISQQGLDVQDAQKTLTQQLKSITKAGVQNEGIIFSKEQIQEIRTFKKEIEGLGSLDSDAALAKIQQIAGKMQGFSERIGTAFDGTAQQVRAGLQGLPESIREQVEAGRAQLESAEKVYETLKQRLTIAIKVQTFTNIAGGISTMARAVTQFQNLGSIWENQDLTTGQKLLQTITNLSFTLPMLIASFKKLSSALSLGIVLTKEQAVASLVAGTSMGKEAAQNTLGGISFHFVGKQAEKAGLQIQLFNKTLLVSPLGIFIAAAAAAAAVIGLVINAINKANQAAIQHNKTTIEEANKTQEQIEKNKELYNSIDELNKKYKEGQITRLELKTQVQDLIQQYGLEGQAADKLRQNYNNLEQAIRSAREAQAEQGKKSAQEQFDAASNNVVRTAVGDVGGNTYRSLDNGYVIDLSPGFLGSAYSDNQDIVKALQEAGGFINAQGGMSFKTNYDTQSIINQYEALKEAIEKINSQVDVADRTSSGLYKATTQQLDRMKESIEAYKQAAQDLKKYSIEEILFDENKTVNFDNVENGNQYLEQRKVLIQEIQAMLEKNGDAEADAKEMADTILRNDYSDLYNQFNQGASAVDEFKKRLGDTGEQSQKVINKLLELDDEHLAEILNIDDQVHIGSWEELLDIIKSIADIQLTNLDPLLGADIDTLKQNASDQYVKYQTLQDDIRSGKTVSSKELQGMPQQIQAMFQMTAKGQYKMTEDAKTFYETINNLKLDGFQKAMQTVENRMDALGKISEGKIDLKGLNDDNIKTLSTENGATVKAVDYDQVGEQLNFLSTVDSANTALSGWLNDLEKNSLTIDQVDQIAARVSQITKTLEESTPGELSEQYKQLAHQMHDALFPTDEDVDEGLLQNLSEVIQNIADESSDLADSLTEDTEAAEDVAESILRFDDAIKDVTDNYDQWMRALSSGAWEDQAAAIEGLRDAYADLLDLDGDSLSEDFLTDTENLQLMKQAIEGNKKAYDQLMEKAGEDIIAHLQLSREDYVRFQADLNDVQSMMDEMNFNSIQVGANLNTGNFLASLQQMVNSAHMTAQQATDYLASMGIDAEVIPATKEVEETVGQDVTPKPYTIPIKYNPATSPDGQPSQVEATYAGIRYDVYPVKAKKQVAGVGVKVTSAHKSAGGNVKFNNSTNGGGGGTSPKKSSGGGGGGSPKSTKPNTNKKDKKKAFDGQIDIYHDINLELKDIERHLDRIQKKQDRLWGKQLLDNLNKQSGILEAHRKKLEEKNKLQEKDLKNQRKVLENLGVQFDEYGNIANYMSILENKQKDVNSMTDQYNGLIQQYNNSTDDAFKKQLDEVIKAKEKELKEAEQSYKNLQDKIKEYDQTKEENEDVKDQIEQDLQKEIEINIKKFNMEVQLRLELGEARRDWNEFRRNVLEHTDIIKDSDFSNIFKDAGKNVADIQSYFNVRGSNQIATLTDQILKTKEQIDQIDKTGTSEIYGDNKAQAMEDLKKYFDQLKDSLQDVYKMVDEVDQAYLDTIDDIADNFNEQIDNYEYIGELIEHDMDLLTLLYGDKNYDAMDSYYKKLQENNLKQVDSLKKQTDFWKQKWDQAVKNGDTAAAKQFEQNYKDSLSKLNQTIEEAAKVLQDKYANAINKIWDQWQKNATNGLGLDSVTTEWDFIKREAEDYLDDINSEFSIQDIGRKFDSAIGDTQSIKNQQKLLKLRDQELEKLRTKEKLTQYDVDRAQKVLQLEQARIALEQAQSAKTSMRLKRDAQGNYSYEYVADDNGVAEAEQKVAELQNSLYNFDKAAYMANQEDILNLVKEYEEKIKEIYLDENLSFEEKEQKKNQLTEWFQGQYTRKVSDNTEIRKNLEDSAFDQLKDLYKTSADDFDQMTAAQKDSIMNNVVPAWDDGVQQMIDKLQKEGGLVPATQNAFDQMVVASKDYENALDELAWTGGKNFEDLKNGQDETADSLSDLIEDNDDLIERMEDEQSAIAKIREEAHALMEQYQNTTKEAKKACTQIQKFIQEQTNEAANYAQTQSQKTTAYENNLERQTTAYENSMQRQAAAYIKAYNDVANASGNGGGNDNGSNPNGNDNNNKKKNNNYYDPGCFSPGTQITMADLSLKNIQDVKVNDCVIAFNDVLNRYEKRKVIKIFAHTNWAKRLVRVSLSNGIIMSMTAGHPVLTTDGWKSLDIKNSLQEHGVEATLLEINDEVLSFYGNTFVQKIQWIQLPLNYTIYNLEVESCHTFVANGTVVHNAKKFEAYATGGYTGDWETEEGRVAVLHEKELVLNKEDTANMLNAVKILRSLTGAVSNKAYDMNNGLAKVAQFKNTTKEELEQKVYIEASFPNVNSKREIEEAFNDLVNLAAQRALK